MIQIYRKITDNFEWEDFACPCCGELLITSRFFKHIEILQSIREKLGFQMNVNSGHRCFRHNKVVGGEEHSEHLNFATDVSPVFLSTDSDTIFEAKVHTLWVEFDKVFDGVGIYSTFVHGDLRGKRARWKV